MVGGGGYSGTEWILTGKRPRGAESVNATILECSAPFKGRGGLLANSKLGAL